MLHIEIETIWRFHKEGSPQTAIVMPGIPKEIGKTGKLTSAADHARLSYRHVWNLVEQWSDFFGVPLVETQRGKGTKLTGADGQARQSAQNQIPPRPRRPQGSLRQSRPRFGNAAVVRPVAGLAQDR